MPRRVMDYVLHYGGTALLLAMLAGIAVLAVGVAALTDPRPPVAYSAREYAPERADLCPGDTLVYTNSLRINRPALVFFGASWFVGHGEAARPRIPGEVVRYTVFSAEQVGHDFTARRTNEVPKLPPGPAEMHFGATTYNAGAAVHVVRFTVREGCP